MSVSFFIEVGVALLLFVAIIFLFTLNKKLAILKQDEKHLKEIISQLMISTSKAEKAIHALKEESRVCQNGLAEKLLEVKQQTKVMDEYLEESFDVVASLKKIAALKGDVTQSKNRNFKININENKSDLSIGEAKNKVFYDKDVA